MTWRRFPKPEKRGRRPRKPVNRFSRSPRRTKERYANELWRHLVYAKMPKGLCPNCGKRPWSCAAHGFIKGRYKHLRFEPSNGIPLCGPCHTIVDSDHLAKEQLWRRFVGDLEYARLKLMAISRGKMYLDLTIQFLEQETRLAKEWAAESGYPWPVLPLARRGDA